MKNLLIRENIMTNQELLLEIKRLKKENLELKGVEKKISEPKAYYFSQITDIQLEKLVDIEQIYNQDIFKKWFLFNYEINGEDINFLKELINKNAPFIFNYLEEDLKIYFIAPLINKVDFFMVENKVRGFFESNLIYETENFIFTGDVDFMVSSGIKRPKTPYFFIQEFKKGKKPKDPEPQLLAEMISAVELNKSKKMKGAFIIGKDWYFVILEKLGVDKYQYFISQNFDSTRIEDLKNIYKNLQFIKNEIIEIVKNEKSSS